jgi:hypothetical protein
LLATMKKYEMIVKVERYNPNWVQQFKNESNELENQIGSIVKNIFTFRGVRRDCSERQVMRSSGIC